MSAGRQGKRRTCASGGQLVRVALVASASRLAILALMLLAGWLVSEYDDSAPLPHECPGSELHDPVVADRWPVADVLEKALVWDSVHMAHAARCGYSYENQYAFFPLLPWALRTLTRTLLAPVAPHLGHLASMALAGLLLSNAAFVAAAVYLYRLTLLVLGDERHAALAAVLYCINPASVHHSAVYTEGLFGLLSIAGMFYSTRSEGTRVLDVAKAAGLFALATALRSNGILNAGFLVYWAAHAACASALRRPARAALAAALGLCASAACLAPFVWFQMRGHQAFCVHLETTGAPRRAWCASALPYIYGWVQKHYWEVGFLRFYRISKIPNILQGAPSLALAAWGVRAYVRHDPGRAASLALPLPASLRRGLQPLARTTARLVGGATAAGSSKKDDDTDERAPANAFLESDRAFPFVVQWAAMALLGALVMHVEVSTRFLSTVPPMYWAVAGASPRLQKRIVAFFLVYAVLGCVLFVNFYPWT
ncbi:unnamed protein product [Pedinophyceae sp. YPF-701]|nr:unnamed protein product [Pedinophyceae sp. YPF-701]